MEKYLKTPKKVTTTSTTIKTVVDQDPTDYDMGQNQHENGKAIENGSPQKRGNNQELQTDGTQQPRKEDLARIAELQEELRGKEREMGRLKDQIEDLKQERDQLSQREQRLIDKYQEIEREKKNEVARLTRNNDDLDRKHEKLERENQEIKSEKQKTDRRLQQTIDELDAKNKALDELKEDFKQVIEFKNQQEQLIENQNVQLEAKGREVDDLQRTSEDRDRELERLRKAVDRLEDR